MTGVAQPHYVKETQVLKRVANDPNCSWRFTRHALEEMGKDGWSADDVKHAVMTGRVILEEQKHDVLWRVSGTDIDGGKIQVVVAVYEAAIKIKIVTTF